MGTVAPQPAVASVFYSLHSRLFLPEYETLVETISHGRRPESGFIQIGSPTSQYTIQLQDYIRYQRSTLSYSKRTSSTGRHTAYTETTIHWDP